MGSLVLTFYLALVLAVAMGGAVESPIGFFVFAAVSAVGFIAVSAAAKLVRTRS